MRLGAVWPNCWVDWSLSPSNSSRKPTNQVSGVEVVNLYLIFQMFIRRKKVTLTYLVPGTNKSVILAALPKPLHLSRSSVSSLITYILPISRITWLNLSQLSFFRIPIFWDYCHPFFSKYAHLIVTHKLTHYIFHARIKKINSWPLHDV